MIFRDGRLYSDDGRYFSHLQEDGNWATYDWTGRVISSMGPDPHPELVPDPPLPPTPMLSRLRVESSRLRNDDGFCGWHGISEFSAIHLVRTGQEGELARRLDRAAAAQRNGIRVLMMAKNLFDLHPGQEGYWEAVEKTVALAAERNLYTELCVFADAQMVMPDGGDRVAFAKDAAAFCNDHASTLAQLANEPFKNGWENATSPSLLDLAQYFSSPFSIGDPQDIVPGLAEALDLLSQHSQILVLHGERKLQDSRWAGWVDHLKGFDEVGQWPCAKIHDEPMGAASTYQDGRRDNRPLAHLAASLVCAIMGMGFTFHYISEQDDATPGLDLCAIVREIPQSPDFRFKNAGTFGSCVTDFKGYDKIRTCDNGMEAWAVGYGYATSLERVWWTDGWLPTIVQEWTQDGGHVALWRATR